MKVFLYTTLSILIASMIVYVSMPFTQYYQANTLYLTTVLTPDNEQTSVAIILQNTHNKLLTFDTDDFELKANEDFYKPSHDIKVELLPNSSEVITIQFITPHVMTNKILVINKTQKGKF